MKVVKTKNVCARDGTLHRVEAIFAKQIGDHSIDVHAEGQMMTHIMMDAGGWHCNMHPQSTVDDLYRSIQSARQTNLQCSTLPATQRGSAASSGMPMTRRLRARRLTLMNYRVPLCWKTPVRDETAIKLCERFHRPLVKSKGGA